MKKVLFLLPLLFLLTGCGEKKVTCTTTVEEDGVKYEAKMIANLKDNKVESGKMELTFGDKETGEQYCNLIKAFMGLAEDENKVEIKCDGKKMTVDSLDFDTEEDEESLIGKTKDDFIKAFKEKYPEATCK